MSLLIRLIEYAPNLFRALMVFLYNAVMRPYIMMKCRPFVCQESVWYNSRHFPESISKVNLLNNFHISYSEECGQLQHAFSAPSHHNACIHACIHPCIHPSIPTYLPTYQHTYQHTNMPTYIHTYLLLLISMLWHRQAIFESRGDKLSSSVECRIRTQGVFETQFSADWMPADKPTELSRIKLKTWTRQPVPMISRHSAHPTPLPFGIRTWRYIYWLLISTLWHRQAIFESNVRTYIHACMHAYIHTYIHTWGYGYGTYLLSRIYWCLYCLLFQQT